MADDDNTSIKTEDVTAAAEAEDNGEKTTNTANDYKEFWTEDVIDTSKHGMTGDTPEYKIYISYEMLDAVGDATGYVPGKTVADNDEDNFKK